jgi:hypothetical protein
MLEPNSLAICANEHAPNAMFDIVQDAAGAWRLQGSLAGDSPGSGNVTRPAPASYAQLGGQVAL